MKYGILSIIAVIALCLSACTTVSNLTGLPLSSPSNVANFVASPAGQSLVTSVASATPQVSSVVAKINSGLASTALDKQIVCAGFSFAHGLYTSVGPLAGASAADNVNEAAASTAVDTICNGNTSNLTAAIATVANAYTATTAKLAATPEVPVVSVPVLAAPSV
jgi:hypothetical protein